MFHIQARARRENNVLGSVNNDSCSNINLRSYRDQRSRQEEKTSASGPTSTETPGPSGRCDFSEEAKGVGLGEFLNRVKASYYKLYPYDVYWDPDVTTDRTRVKYVTYDPSPSAIKNQTDTALALLKEISHKKLNTEALKPRERKALK